MDVQSDKIRIYSDLKVYQVSYQLAMEIFELSKKIPKVELYSLTSQIIRSSRSVSANISEGWAKRKYENVFLRHLVDAYGSCIETKTWLSFAKDCEYITLDQYNRLTKRYDEIGAMLSSLIKKWRTF